MKETVFYVNRVRYIVRWYRNAIGEKTIAYVMKSKGKDIISITKDKDHIHDVAKRKIEEGK